jgi:hypothetical protein
MQKSDEAIEMMTSTPDPTCAGFVGTTKNGAIAPKSP